MTVQEHADQILKLLSGSKNVILMGPPATGKSLIMAEVAKKFPGTGGVRLNPSGPVPLPAAPTIEAWMPSAARTSNRNVFQINFHQGTKHRDFVSGIIPKLGETQTGFKVIEGLLMKANANAKTPGASLLLIDEINRGPAVTIFGDTLSSIEMDKRLDNDDQPTNTSSPFYSYSDGGEMLANYLSSHLYILASMNEADTSVEPLDIAFLRRFSIYRLYPDVAMLYGYLGITQETETPEIPTTKEHVLSALVKTWIKANERISIGKSEAFQIGHGIFVSAGLPADLPQALEYAATIWRKIETHVAELFYGDDLSLSNVFNAQAEGVYSIKDVEFADQVFSKFKITDWKSSDVYSMLIQVTNEAQGQ